MEGGNTTMNDATEPNFDNDKQPPSESDESPKVIAAQKLFEGQREICIEHAGSGIRRFCRGAGLEFRCGFRT